MSARKDGKPHRPNVTEQELKALYDACDVIRAEEPQLSVRAYAYRIGKRATYDEDGNAIDGIRLHGDICTKEPPAPGEDPINTESIQRYILKGRRDGRLSYESVIDDTRPTHSGGCGWDDRAEAEKAWADARKTGIRYYSLDIWTPQKKFVEVLSEKLALEPIVKRPCDKWEVDLTSCKGFSSESLLYRKARETVMRDVPTVYLVLVDLDRAAKNMAESMERIIRSLVKMLAEKLNRPMPDLTFVHIGLTLEQANSFDEVDLRPCKLSEKPTYRHYTPWCAEVDFCSSEHIIEIVENAIKAQLDVKIERKRQRQEKADKAWFRSTERLMTMPPSACR